MRLYVIAYFACCVTTAYAADFYDFRLGPDGGVTDEMTEREKITDFINVKDEHLMEEAQSELTKAIIFSPEKVQFKELKVIIDQNGKKVTCGKISTITIRGKRVKFRPFSYSENGINMLKKTGFENSRGKYGDKLRLRQKAWQKHYKALGC